MKKPRDYPPSASHTKESSWRTSKTALPELPNRKIVARWSVPRDRLSSLCAPIQCLPYKETLNARNCGSLELGRLPSALWQERLRNRSADQLVRHGSTCWSMIDPKDRSGWADKKTPFAQFELIYSFLQVDLVGHVCSLCCDRFPVRNAKRR